MLQNYFDKIYCINLDRRIDRWEHFLNQSKKINLDNFERVSAIDGNKLNNHISNLEWITPSENILHAIKNNLIKRSFKQNEMLGIRSRKKCIDVKTNIIYDSLKEACDKNNLKYSCELNKIQRKANTIRFLYL
jgi:hypothetical protein